jgi:hypothetical protein
MLDEKCANIFQNKPKENFFLSFTERKKQDAEKIE